MRVRIPLLPLATMGRPQMMVAIVAGALALGCRPSPPPPAASTPSTDAGASPAARERADARAHPLAGVVGQPLLITPVQAFKIAPELGWAAPRTQDVLHAMDADLTAALSDRVHNHGWMYADAAVAAYMRNATYATDPRQLNSEPLRAKNLTVGNPVTEPLGSQIRTMIALSDARMVLIPAELRIEKMPSGMGRAVLRLVLIDGRTSEIQWAGEAYGDPAAAYGPAVTASVASHVADLITPP